MTKKILIDEAVVKQVLEALENHPGNYKLSKAECVTYNAAEGALREALEVNNKGVNATESLTLDDLKVLRKAARCLQWAIQTESLLEKVAPGGHSNEKDYCDAAEGLKSICEKYSTAPQPAEQDLAELIDALKKFRGLPPHNSMSNPCQGDGYFYAGIEAKYTPEQIATANVALDTSTKQRTSNMTTTNQGE